MTFSHIIEYIGRGLEATGIAIIVIGIVISLVVYLSRVFGEDGPQAAFTSARKDIGRSILFGLEVLVAGDIVLTVAIDPTFRSVGVLAAIVLIRTFLSFTLEVEIDGQWPWQKDRDPSQETV